ncbi:hypothetical protein POLEWNIK_00310 [Brevundimonas phage vB_BpoS-Polewnik]|nr:hypothetical protein POLEWNIK_00310 [Brevundimonas phage vB_BpoS-Polewnik]
MQTKPQIVRHLNPRLPMRTRVNLKDGREGTIMDRAEERHQRLVAFPDLDRPILTAVGDITGGRMPDGSEFHCEFNGKSLKSIVGSAT